MEREVEENVEVSEEGGRYEERRSWIGRKKLEKEEGNGKVINEQKKGERKKEY